MLYLAAFFPPIACAVVFTRIGEEHRVPVPFWAWYLICPAAMFGAVVAWSPFRGALGENVLLDMRLDLALVAVLSQVALYGAIVLWRRAADKRDFVR